MGNFHKTNLGETCAKTKAKSETSTEKKHKVKAFSQAIQMLCVNGWNC